MLSFICYKLWKKSRNWTAATEGCFVVVVYAQNALQLTVQITLERDRVYQFIWQSVLQYCAELVCLVCEWYS